MTDTTKKNASILIVEDEAIVAKDIANKLGCLGYTVAGSATQGEEALVLARARHPDAVLMDIRLGGSMDGVEAADRMRRECDLAVIYLTAHSDRATLDRAKRTEPVGYIIKPFQVRDLETQIEMALYRLQANRKLRKNSEALSRSNHELESINQMMVGRELRMIELKKEIDKLCHQFGQPLRYGYSPDSLSPLATQPSPPPSPSCPCS